MKHYQPTQLNMRQHYGMALIAGLILAALAALPSLSHAAHHTDTTTSLTTRAG